MPYTSLMQERFFHSPAAKAAGITDDEVEEFDHASKGLHLPMRARLKRNQRKRRTPLQEAIILKHHGR